MVNCEHCGSDTGVVSLCVSCARCETAHRTKFKDELIGELTEACENVNNTFADLELDATLEGCQMVLQIVLTKVHKLEKQGKISLTVLETKIPNNP